MLPVLTSDYRSLEWPRTRVLAPFPNGWDGDLRREGGGRAWWCWCIPTHAGSWETAAATSQSVHVVKVTIGPSPSESPDHPSLDNLAGYGWLAPGWPNSVLLLFKIRILTANFVWSWQFGAVWVRRLNCDQVNGLNLIAKIVNFRIKNFGLLVQ